MRARTRGHSARMQPLTPRKNLLDYRALYADAHRRLRTLPIPGVRARQHGRLRDELKHALQARRPSFAQSQQHRLALEALGHACLRAASMPGRDNRGRR